MFRKILLILVLTLTLATTTFAQLSTSSYLKPAEGGKGLQISTSYCPFGSLNCKKGEYVSGVSGATNFSLKLLGGLLNFAAIVAVIFLIIGGARLVLAGGSSEGLGAAKKHILWTIGGLFVVIISMIIVRNLTDVVYESTDKTLQDSKDGARVLPMPEAATEITPDIAQKAETLACPDGSQIDIVEGFVATNSGKFSNAKTDVGPFKAEFTTASAKAQGLARDGGIGTEFASNKVVAAILTDMVFSGNSNTDAFMAGVKQATQASSEEAKNKAWDALASAASKPAYKDLLAELAKPNGTVTANQALISKAKGSSSFLCAAGAPPAPAEGVTPTKDAPLCPSKEACIAACQKYGMDINKWPGGPERKLPTNVSKIQTGPGLEVAGDTSDPRLLGPVATALANAGNIANGKGYKLVVKGALRSVETQIQLACKNDAAMLKAGTAAKPGGSNHGSGIAVDVQLWKGGSKLTTSAVPNDTGANAKILWGIMKEGGFSSRLCTEHWHFEYGNAPDGATRCALQ